MYTSNKNLIIVLLTFLTFSILTLNAQEIGNGKSITKDYQLSEIYKFESNLYADITIDMEAPEGITITAEENIIDLIGMNRKGGTLMLDQIKWIEPTKRIIIVVGLPDLREVVMSTHDKLEVINVVGEIFKVEAEIGTISLSGKVDDIKIKSKNGIVEAANLLSKSGTIDIKGDGKAYVNVSTTLDCDLNEDATLVNTNKKALSSGCTQKKVNETNSDCRYIDLKIKNNSWSRKHFVVVGPKPNGRNFSYGFPMMPGAVKTERWTTGTKVYKENSLGMRKLLVVLTEEDEGKTVKLFD